MDKVVGKAVPFELAVQVMFEGRVEDVIRNTTYYSYRPVSLQK